MNLANQLIVLADGVDVIQTAEQLSRGTIGVLRLVTLAVAIALILATWWKTRAWVPTLAMVVISGIVLFAVNNDDFMVDSAEETIEEAGDRAGGE